MKRLRFAFGPEASAFGSWEWIGADLSREPDRQGYETTTFRNTVPDCDVAVFVKFKPSAEDLTALRKTNRFLVYCPVDLYDRDRWLSTDYWKEIQQLVPRLNAELSLPMIAQQFLQMLRE